MAASETICIAITVMVARKCFNQGALTRTLQEYIERGRSFLLTGKSLFTYEWSLLLTVNWLGLFHLRLKFGLVFLAYGGKLVRSFLLFFLTARPCPELGLVFFAYGSPRPELGWVSFAYGSRTVSKKTNRA